MSVKSGEDQFDGEAATGHALAATATIAGLISGTMLLILWRRWLSATPPVVATS